MAGVNRSNVAVTDTFDTWRIRTNEVNTTLNQATEAITANTINSSACGKRWTAVARPSPTISAPTAAPSTTTQTRRSTTAAATAASSAARIETPRTTRPPPPWTTAHASAGVATSRTLGRGAHAC